MTPERIAMAEEEAKRFLGRLRLYKAKLKEDNMAHCGCKESGALKRTSMDLSRALSELRKGNY